MAGNRASGFLDDVSNAVDGTGKMVLYKVSRLEDIP